MTEDRKQKSEVGRRKKCRRWEDKKVRWSEKIESNAELKMKVFRLRRISVQVSGFIGLVS
jgi:hypothetical protein